MEPKPKSASANKPADDPRWPWEPPESKKKTLPLASKIRTLPLKSHPAKIEQAEDALMNPHEPHISTHTFEGFANTHGGYTRPGPIANRTKEDFSKHLPRELAVPRTHNAQLTTRREIPVPCRPTRILIQKHTFWRATLKSCSAQWWTFDIARNRKHKVCVVLLWQKARLFGSLPIPWPFGSITPISREGDVSTG